MSHCIKIKYITQYEMPFNNINDPETISLIVGAISTLLPALGAFIGVIINNWRTSSKEKHLTKKDRVKLLFSHSRNSKEFKELVGITKKIKEDSKKKKKDGRP